VTHARTQHPNARLTPKHRRTMVGCVLEKGWTIEATAERFQVDAKTVRKWRDRFLAEGEAGLQDRASRPHRSPNRTSRSCRRRVIELRRKHRWGADHIAHETGLAASTVQSILRDAGLARLDWGDRATNTERPLRYQRDRPGELIHVDVKKIAGIPNGGGWRIHGRGNDGHGGHSKVGYRYIHTALDDRTRIAYSELLTDEQADTAAQFWLRAVAFFAALGIPCERVITDNGACYRSRCWHSACAATGTKMKKTRPRRPQTNGKVERFHRILLEEWAYIRPWHSDAERTTGYAGFMHFYNHHRSHGALGWASPIETLNRLCGDNLPAEHN
jgi:transposase InsO family protein